MYGLALAYLPQARENHIVRSLASYPLILRAYTHHTHMQVCTVMITLWHCLWCCCLCQPLPGRKTRLSSSYCSVYTFFLPTRYLKKLPQDVLNALDLSHPAGFLAVPPPPSPRDLLSQRIISNLHSHSGLSPTLQLRVVARELVQFSLQSARTKLNLTTPSLNSRVPDIAHHLWQPSSSWLPQPQCNSTEPQAYRQDKRMSVMGKASSSSVDSESEEEEDGALRLPRVVSLRVEGTVIDEEEFDDEWSGEEVRAVEDALRLAAKKIVKKALHLACKRWESMHRRSSIDYLVASTKRLKIAPPSPPPTLPEEEKAQYDSGVAASIRPRTGWDTHSHPMGHGKKRNRSESHDIMMMKELEIFRRAQMAQEAGERVIAKPRRSAAWGVGRGDGPSGPKNEKRPSAQSLESMGELISDIHRLSLKMVESDPEEGYSSDEDYTVLSGVTRPAGGGGNSDSDAVSPVPPPNSPTSLQVLRGGANRSPSPLLHKVLPSALRQIPQYTGTSADEENTTCTSPEFRQKLSTLQPMSELLGVTATPGDVRDPFLIFGKDCPIPEMDYYIIVHTYPPPGVCQKFLCGNTDEVNLLYHCWLYPDVPCHPEVVCSQSLSMGVFQPCGVAPVHQDLQDAGVAFHHLQPRSGTVYTERLLQVEAVC